MNATKIVIDTFSNLNRQSIRKKFEYLRATDILRVKQDEYIDCIKMYW